jgi:hypothetical protein
MEEVCSLIWLALVGAFRSRAALEAENTILRHQLNVLRRQLPKRPTFVMLDRLIFAGLYRLAPKVLGALAIVMLIGVGSRRRSAGQAIDLPNDRGVNLGRLFTYTQPRSQPEAATAP